MKTSGGWSKIPHAITDAMPRMTLPELACTILLVNDGRWLSEYFGSDRWENKKEGHEKQLEFFGFAVGYNANGT